MTPTRRVLFRLLPGAALLGAAAPSAARAQGTAWPSGPVRLIAPFPPGGSVDTILRLLQPHLQRALGTPIVVENRSGASGALGTAALARAAPDGQTFGLVFDTHAVNQFIIPSLGFDARADFAPVMLVGTAPMLIAAHVARPWRSLAEAIAAAKARPDTITYGTVGVGSLAHLTMTLMQKQGGFRLVHVPYRGGGPMSTAAAAGELDLAMATNAGLGGQVGTTLRPLAQTGARRSPNLPDLPTVAESGVPGIDALAWWGMLAPARTPEGIVRRFHAALEEALAVPEVRARLSGPMGIDVVASSPEAFGAFLERQMEIWGQVVRENNIRPE
ncbi:tripartite tricarboxylate transporter substrate-binding protein [Caldovatus aquaticus]|uniref:Tripartite tricarboxylate transporter substrate binding protein n=1 Tax=Caldovatus aquaticus TaxID=2865671 RepID=A0ABS7EZU8_9PROT|nr:tripartite tricarboxylate transporter substrate-binding protein [Caldovatus aquaticus]MBW8268603.1 tripartite tricarboxylate transporter substrate binding protein [Caldovatus aquaticus]